MWVSAQDIECSLRGKCPRCLKGNVFQEGFAFDFKDKCGSCGLDFSKADVGDGAAFFLIFILGFILVPIALYVSFAVEIPLWAHAIIWTVLSLGFTLGGLRPLKAYLLTMQFRHRASEWDKD